MSIALIVTHLLIYVTIQISPTAASGFLKNRMSTRLFARNVKKNLFVKLPDKDES